MAKILVVDDVQLERSLISLILRRAGHSVIEAADGNEAVLMAKEFNPDVVFMDIVMPVVDGFTATKRLMMAPETKNIPIIVVSSKPQESDKFRAKQLGAKGYIVKPANERNILDALAQVFTS